MPGRWAAAALALLALVGCQKVDRGGKPPPAPAQPGPILVVYDAAVPDAAVPDAATVFRLDQDGGGDPERDGIRRAMQSLTPAFLRCLQTAAPAFQGKVTLRFTIDGTGTVRTPFAEGAPPGLGQCMIAGLTSLRFGPTRAGGSISISFPVIFP